MSIRKQVREFMVAAGQDLPGKPTIPSMDVAKLRTKLVLEEVLELTDATFGQNEPNMVEIADALADLDYVVEGMRLALGIDGKPIADEVHRSNMAKFGPGSWKREDGKQMKPPDWTPPNIAKILEEQSKG